MDTITKNYIYTILGDYAPITEITGQVVKNEFKAVLDNYREDQKQLKEQDFKASLYVYNTQVAELIKQYFLYLRNTYIEKLKAKNKLVQDHITEEKYHSYIADVIADISKVKKNLLQEIELVIDSLKSAETVDKINYELRLVHNPVGIYDDNFHKIKIQLQDIVSSESAYKTVKNKLKYIESTCINQLQSLRDETANLLEKYNKSTQAISSEHPEIAVFQALEKEIKKDIEQLSENESWMNSLNDFIAKLEPASVVVDYEDGHIVNRDIALRSLLEKWLSLDIIPRYNIIKDEMIRTLNKLMQVQRYTVNSLIRGADENAHLMDSIKKGSQRNLEEVEVRSNAILENITKLEDEIKSELTEFDFFKQEAWLDQGFRNTFSQVKTGTESLYKNFQETGTRLFKKIKNYLYDAHKNNTPINELVVNFLQSRSLQKTSSSYVNIFLDKEGISDYYLVERKEPTQKLKNAIESWYSGFGTSVLIQGSPACGKSSFIKHHMKAGLLRKAHLITPNTIVTVNGRKFNTGEDIKIALDNFKQSLSPQEKYILVLDDLELWRDSKGYSISILRFLIEYIDRSHKNILVICSANTQFVKTANVMLDFANLFTFKIDLSFFDKQEFMEALEIRHHSTQKQLRDKNKTVLHLPQIKKIANEIYTANNYNIGSALKHWVANINEEEIIKKKKVAKNTFPLFVSDENIFLINYFLVYKKATEKDILGIIDPEETKRYLNLIGRFLRHKILKRTEDNFLILNPDIKNKLSIQIQLYDQKRNTHNYIIEAAIPVNMDIKEKLNEVKKVMFIYPFKSLSSKCEIDHLKNNLRLTIHAIEPPAKILEYLNNAMVKIKFEFKTNI
jgi:hypothetical protein